jgi:hypothetical protein
MRVFKVLGGALLVISLLVGCASSQATADHPGVKQQDSVEESKPDNEVYETFVGTDAQAMAALGQRVERDRPPLKPEVVDRMLIFLREHPEEGPPLGMLRPMLFRSVAVVVGKPAIPSLQRCATEAPKLAELCQGAFQELSGTHQ